MPIGIDRDHAMTIPVTGHYLHIIDDNGELIEPRDTVIGYVIYSSPPTARDSDYSHWTYPVTAETVWDGRIATQSFRAASSRSAGDRIAFT